MTAYSGGEQIQNYLDPNRPDYGGIVLASSESGSALKRALVKLSADVAGAKEMADASEKATKMGAAGIVDRANAGTFAAGAIALGQGVSGFMRAIPTGNTGNTKYGLGGGAGQGELEAPLSTGDNALSLLDSFLGRD
jgi:hypothetical protein